MFRACCGNRFPHPNGRLKIKRECCGGGGGGERFFLDGQYSDDEYSSAISFITFTKVVTYTKENDLCLRVIQKRKTIYMVFCICMQYKCLRIQFVSMWYFIKLNVFCKELIQCVEIVPCTRYCSKCYSRHRSRPCKTKLCFVVIVVVEMTVLGRPGKTTTFLIQQPFLIQPNKTCILLLPLGGL